MKTKQNTTHYYTYYTFSHTRAYNPHAYAREKLTSVVIDFILFIFVFLCYVLLFFRCSNFEC